MMSFADRLNVGVGEKTKGCSHLKSLYTLSKSSSPTNSLVCRDLRPVLRTTMDEKIGILWCEGRLVGQQ